MRQGTTCCFWSSSLVRSPDGRDVQDATAMAARRGVGSGGAHVPVVAVKPGTRRDRQSQCPMCGVSTHSGGPPKAPSWRHRKHGIWPWGPETCPLAPNTPVPLPRLFSSPQPHFFVFSGAEMSEALIFVSPFTNPRPPPKDLAGDLSSSPLHGCLEAVLGSSEVKHFIFTHCVRKDLGPGRREGVEALAYHAGQTPLGWACDR